MYVKIILKIKLTEWISSVASRNPHQTDHFLDYCKIILINKLIKENSSLKLIYTPNTSIKKIIQKIINKNSNKIIVINKNRYEKLKSILKIFIFLIKNFKILFLSKFINSFYTKLKKILFTRNKLI